MKMKISETLGYIFIQKRTLRQYGIIMDTIWIKNPYCIVPSENPNASCGYAPPVGCHPLTGNHYTA